MLLKTIKNWSLYLKEDTNTVIQRKKSIFKPLTKDAFNLCPFKEYIFQNQTVYFIYEAGSVLNNTVDELSDHDLVIITKESYEPEKQYCLEYNGRHIHWYYQAFNTIIPDIIKANNFNLSSGRDQCAALTPDNILYVNYNYKQAFYYFMQHKQLIADIGLYTAIKHSKKLIQNYGEPYFDNLDITKQIPKYFYKMLLIYYRLKNETPDYLFIQKIKRALHNGITIKEYQQLRDLLTDYLKILPEDSVLDNNINTNILQYNSQDLNCLDKLTTGIIFLHFPENNQHGCDKHCQYCFFRMLNYNIPIIPDDNELELFLNDIKPGATIQLCGAGDPLYNFEKHKDYFKHIVDLIHQHDMLVQLVTKYTEIVDKCFETDLNTIDLFSFSVETIEQDIYNIIDKITKAGKQVRLSKIVNFTENIHDINWEYIEKFVAFYGHTEKKDLLSIALRPNFNFNYEDTEVAKEIEKAFNLESKYQYHIYMHAQSNHIAKLQLWNGRRISCSDTHYYVYKDLGLEIPPDVKKPDYL